MLTFPVTLGQSAALFGHLNMEIAARSSQRDDRIVTAKGGFRVIHGG
jgi:hypothetical protein